MIVVDASAALEALLHSSAAAKVNARLFASGQIIHAPHLLDVEVAQVIRRYVAQGQLTQSAGQTAISDFRTIPIRRHEHTSLLPRIWELRRNMTAYDAAYVALAEALQAPLLTTDARLARAPGHRALVELA